jgi:hypothetical protein
MRADSCGASAKPHSSAEWCVRNMDFGPAMRSARERRPSPTRARKMPAETSALLGTTHPETNFSHFGTVPLLMVVISLDTLDARAHNPGILSGIRALRWGIWGSRRRLGRKQIWEADAISAGFDGAVFESRMSRARALAARGGHPAGNLQQLRGASAWCAAAVAAKIPDEAASVECVQAQLPAEIRAPRSSTATLGCAGFRKLAGRSLGA